jgi:benzoyl-CoA reductase/2-hydroxyglutaryl-CoA dehydratase subunit BcrC/BadD/HgdB
MGSAVSGEFSALSGVVMLNTCDGMRRLYDAWKHYCGPPFSFLLDLPRISRPYSVSYFRGRLERLKRALEEHFQVEITSERLFQAIEAANHTLSLCSRLNELQGRGDPPLRRSDILEILSLGSRVPREAFNRALESMVSDLEASPERTPSGVKVMIAGSPLCGSGLVRLVEELGGEVTEADLCIGGRFRRQIPLTGDALAWLSKAYLGKAPCARMWDSAGRIEHIKGGLFKSGAKGLIYHSLKFCDPYLYEAPAVQSALEGLGVPVLAVEGEYSYKVGGGIRTRVQAFLEMLEANEGRTNQ